MPAPSKRNQVVLLIVSWILLIVAAVALVLIFTGHTAAGVALTCVFIAGMLYVMLRLRERLGFRRSGGWDRD